MLTVSLANPEALPSQPTAPVERPQVADLPQVDEQTPVADQLPPLPVLESKQAPIVQAEPLSSPDPVHQQTQIAATTESSLFAADQNMQASPDEQTPTTVAGILGPKADVIDTTRIGEEFKKALLNLLAYPEAARRRGVQGTVGLRIAMDAEGRIIEALVSQTSGSSILDRAAVAAALATPGPLVGPGHRLELALRVSFEAGRVLTRP